MRQALRVFPFVLFLLGACSANGPDVRWAQAQTVYNEAATALKLYRAPCVDKAAYINAGPDHPLCRIDSATWLVVYPLMQQADDCLKAADQLLQRGVKPAIEDALACAERALERLLIYNLAVKGT